jgi:hypothetical protein
MTTVTLDLPGTLAQRLREQQITEREIGAIAVAALEVWLEQSEGGRADQSRAARRFGESAVPFVRQLIEQNRTLFETLAQR